MPDVSEEDLRKEIEKILKFADLSKVSTKKVIQQLEETFDTELKDRKAVGQMVMDYVNSMDDDEDEKEDDDDEEEEEEEPKKPPKRSAASTKRSKKARKASSDEYEASDGNDSEDEEDDDRKKRSRRSGASTKRSSDEASDGNDSEYEEKKSKPKKAAAKGKKAGAKGGGRGKGGGYTRAYKLSPALADLMGADEMPRHEVVKRMWAIIKEKQLYDQNNKQFAICDEPLYKVIGTKRFRIFGMMKYLKSHFLDE